jgi:peptide/nickel transport system substrate-binding protein
MVGEYELEFGVLGPIEVRDSGRTLALGGPKQRALLADLILNARTVVSTARLIDDLWGEAAPPSADHTAEVYVARLRRVLRRDFRPEVLLTRPPGYLLDVEPEQVDVLRFSQLVTDGTAAASRGDHEQASALLRAGLALWRGQALADVTSAPFASAAAARLADQHLIAVERRIEADLQLGRAQDVIPELEGLLSSHPYHEPFHRQLMLALYRSGRQSDALSAFRRARGLLTDDLGIEPGWDLRRMEQAILRQDPELEQSPAAPRRIQLPEPSSTSHPQARTAEPGGRAPRWQAHHMRVLIAALLAIAVVAGLSVSLAPGPSAGENIAANSIGILSASGNSVTADLGLPTPPGDLAVGGGSVWATSPTAHVVYRINPASHAITQVIPVGAGADGLAYSDGDIWVANALTGTVSRINSSAGQVVQTTGAGSIPTGVAAGFGAVWVTARLGSAVYRISPSSGQVTATIGLVSSPYGVTVGAGSLWVTSPDADSVTRIDPVAGQPVQSVSVGADPTAIAYGFGSVWVANTLDSTVSRIDPATGAVTGVISVGNGPTALAVSGSGVWVTDAAGTVVRIDPATSRVVSNLRVGDPALAVAVVKGVPWVGTGVGYPSRHRGGTLRVLSSLWCGTYDPAIGFGLCFPPAFGEDTYDTLVTFQSTGGNAGTQLVPDLALAIPAPQAGGTQYTFVLRPGLRYSNGAPVRPEDFRYALERVLQFDPYERSLLSGLIGARECQTGWQCDLSRAITVDDHARTVTFHLTAPDEFFLTKLVPTFNAPVPASEPAHPVGTTPVPGTGPYMITRYIQGREVDFARNPYFREWSAAARPDGFPDKIVWRFGLTPAQEVAAIEAGRADWMADPPPNIQALSARYYPQVHIDPQLAIAYAAFNVTVPPFNDLRVRQAVSLAADRNAAVAALGGPDAAQPTCQIIPPGLPGYRRYCPYTVDPSGSGAWVGPDLVRARQLVAASHTEGMRVVVWVHQWEPDQSLAPYFVNVLRELGYRASIQAASVATFARNVDDTRRRVQVSIGTWGLDYPSASDLFDVFFRCSAFRPADPADTRSGSFFCQPAIDREMSQADQLQVSDPQAAADVWASVDRQVTYLAPWVPFASLRGADFTSARARNYQSSPAEGILLDQLWVR